MPERSQQSYSRADLINALIGQPPAPWLVPGGFGENPDQDAIRLKEYGEHLDRGDRRERLANALLQTWPAQAVKSAWSGFTLPGDVYAGKVDPRSPEGIERAFDLAGSLALGAGAIPADDALRMGIKAYHGSPHDFEKFELSPRTSRSGEGAQTYGHGLYFAENPKVAQTYRDELAASQAKTPELSAARILDLHNGDREAALGYLAKRVDEAYASRDLDRAKDLLAAKAAIADGRKLPTTSGHLYEVDLNADPSRLLDWDSPIARQSESVRMAIQPLVRGDDTAADLYRRLASEHGAAEASKILKEAGIPGIRYLDQGSREAGSGTSNFVIFDDNLPTILRR